MHKSQGHQVKSVTFGSIEWTWCFIFQVPTFRSRLRCPLLSCTEHCQLALGRILPTKLLHGSKLADDSCFDLWVDLQNEFLRIFFFNTDYLFLFWPDNLHLTFHSLHALLINGHWVAYQKQEPEIGILYRTLQICIKSNLLCSLCKESKYSHLKSISHVLNCQFVFYFLSQEFTLLHLGISHAHNVLAIYALFCFN